MKVECSKKNRFPVWEWVGGFGFRVHEFSAAEFPFHPSMFPLYSAPFYLLPCDDEAEARSKFFPLSGS